MRFAGRDMEGYTTEQSVKFWSEVGLNYFMMPYPWGSLEFWDKNSHINYDAFGQMSELQEEYSMNIFLHPFLFKVGGRYLNAGNTKHHGALKFLIRSLDCAIQEYDLYPYMIIHPPTYFVPGKFVSDKDKTLKISADFYQDLGLETNFVIENSIGCAPYDDSPELVYAIGYSAEQLRTLIGDTYDVCIDIGHLKLSGEEFSDFFDLPIQFVHLHGNDGKEDLHKIPTMHNVGNVDQVRTFLKASKGPIVLDVKGLGTGDVDKTIIKTTMSFWK